MATQQPDDDGTLPDARWGTAETPLPNWRAVLGNEDDDPDDEELPETPPDVIAALGFDPLEEAAADEAVARAIAEALAPKKGDA